MIARSAWRTGRWRGSTFNITTLRMPLKTRSGAARPAATPYDRNAGEMASATGLLLEGRIGEGLTQLLALKNWALAGGWLYSAGGVDFAVGPALAFVRSG